SPRCPERPHCPNAQARTHVGPTAQRPALTSFDRQVRPEELAQEAKFHQAFVADVVLNFSRLKQRPTFNIQHPTPNSESFREQAAQRRTSNAEIDVRCSMFAAASPRSLMWWSDTPATAGSYQANFQPADRNAISN